MANGGGEISFTTKELLIRLDEKLDRMDDRMDAKAELTAVLDLTNRVAALEQVAVRREGPLVHQFQESMKKLEGLDRELEKWQDGMGREIERRISVAAKAATEARDRTLTRREKTVVIGTASLGALGTFVSMFVLVWQVVVH